MYPQLIHVDVWQKPTQYCKAIILQLKILIEGLHQWLSGKESTCNVGDVAEAKGLIPGLRSCPGEGNGNPLQYSCLGKPMDRGT